MHLTPAWWLPFRTVPVHLNVRPGLVSGKADKHTQTEDAGKVGTGQLSVQLLTNIDSCSAMQDTKQRNKVTSIVPVSSAFERLHVRVSINL